MPIQASFGRKSTYRVYAINGDQLAAEDLGSDEEAVAWARLLVKDGDVRLLVVGRAGAEVFVHSKQLRQTANGTAVASITVWETDVTAATYRP